MEHGSGPCDNERSFLTSRSKKPWTRPWPNWENAPAVTCDTTVGEQKRTLGAPSSRTSLSANWTFRSSMRTVASQPLKKSRLFATILQLVHQTPFSLAFATEMETG